MHTSIIGIVSAIALPGWFFLAQPSVAHADVKLQRIDYHQGDTKLQGWIAFDDQIKAPRPGIVVFPEWWGLTDYPKNRAQQLAKLGYIAFAADMYGDGQTTDDPAEAGKLATAVKSDTDLMRARAEAALTALRADPHVDPQKIAAIGYCFGGTVALELARDGADLNSVVVFHAGLPVDHPEDDKNIKAPLLICTGGADAFVPPDLVDTFKKQLDDAKVTYRVIVYPGAHHAFTNPDADRHHIDNIKYDPDADQKSWQAMREEFEKVFGSPAK